MRWLSASWKPEHRRWWIGAFYLALIPIFALIFCWLHEPFYHSTVRLEPSVRRMPRDLAARLRSEIAAGIVANYPGGLIRVGAWDTKADMVDVATVRSGTQSVPLYVGAPEDAFARFVLRVTARDTSGLVLASYSADVSLEVAMEMPDSILCYTRYSIDSVSPPGLGARQTASPILRARADSIMRSTQGNAVIGGQLVQAILSPENQLFGSVPLSSDLVNALHYYCNAVSGFPAHVEGSFLRMLYVSAVTITTLGFGDVVPVTGWARFWTAVEAVSGIVIIGLFVNSVAAQGRKGREGDVLSADVAPGTSGAGNVLRDAEVKRTLYETASAMRGKAQDHMVTLAAAALALTLTFRGDAAHSSWLLRGAWVALTLCVLLVIAERLYTSRQLTRHTYENTAPTKQEKWVMGTMHVSSLYAFGVGAVALAVFGFLNL